MKKLLFTFLISASLFSFAQAPQEISYQGVARNASGSLLANQNIGIKLDLHQGSAGGAVVFSETHSKTTNSFGLFILGIGSVNTAAFTAINWANGPYFLEVSMDPAGGSSYTSVGTQQFMSVPYALYAKTAGNATTYSAGTGINVTGNTISNTAPDQTVALNAAGATTVTGTYPNFTINTPAVQTYSAGSGIDITGGVISNTAAAVTPTIVGTGATTVNGVYPNLSINSPTTQVYSAGNGIDITGGVISNTAAAAVTPTIVGTGATTVTGVYPNLTINTPTVAPDQAVSLTGTGTATVTGSYPNFTVNVPTGAALPTAFNGQFLFNNGTIWDTLPRNNLFFDGTNFGVGTTAPQATFHVVGAGRFDASVSTPQIYTNAIQIAVGTFTNAGDVLTNDGAGNGIWQAIPSPTLSYNNGTNVLTLTQGTVVTTATLVGTGSNTVSIVGSGLATVTPTTGSSFTVSVQSPTITGTGATTVTGTYPNITISSPTVAAASPPTIIGTGATTVTSSGNTFTVNTPASQTYTNGAGISVTSGSIITNTAPNQTVTLNGTGATTVTGTYPNFTINTATTSSTPPTIIGTGATTVTSSGNTFTVNTPASQTYTNGAGISITSGSIITNTAPNQTITLNGTGATTVTGTYPNFTVTSPTTAAAVTPTITGTGIAVVTPTTGNNFTVNVPTQTLTVTSNSVITSNLGGTATITPAVLSYTPGTNTLKLTDGLSVNTVTLNSASSTSLTQGANVTVLGSAPNYTVSSVTPTLSVVGGALAGTYPSQTLTIPTSSTTILTQSTGVTVTGTAPNYTISSASQSLSVSGNSLSITGANTVTIPTSSVVAGNTNITVATSGNTYSVSAVTPTLNVVGGALAGTYPTQTLTIPTNSTTSISQGTNVIVSGAAPNYTVSSVTPTLSVIGGTLTGSYPTQTLTVPTNTTPGTNGFNSITKSTAEPVGINCADGGTKIESGLDNNSNSILDAGEITSTSYVCNGAAGSPGPAGSPASVVKITNSSIQSLPNNANIAVLYNSEILDADNLHDNVTNPTRITITTPGRYMAVGTIGFSSNATGIRRIMFNKNSGVADEASSASGLAANNIQLHGSIIYDLVPGDYIELIAFQNSGTALTIPVGKSELSLFSLAGGRDGTNGAPGTLAAGTAVGNTTYWDGVSWVLNSSNLFNNGANIGIGTSAPGAKLEVNGQVKITGGAPANGAVLTSDATGLASWQIPGAAGGVWTRTAPYIYPTTLSDKVGIGTNAPAYKLDISETFSNNGGAAVNVLTSSSSSGGANSGIYSNLLGSASGNYISGYFRSEALAGATGSPLGVKGLAVGTNLSSATGVSGTAMNGSQNTGVYGYGSGVAGTTNYGVFGEVAGPGFAGYFTGGPTLVDGKFVLWPQAVVPTAFGGQGSIYYDNAAQKFKVSENGNPYVDLLGGAGSSPWTQGAGTITQNNPGDLVGIGSVPPTSQLHVSGISDPLQITVENGGGNFRTGYHIKTALNEWFMGQDGSSSTGFRITDKDAFAVRFQIDQDGRIGMGTTSASERLDVNGNIKLDSSLMVTGLTSVPPTSNFGNGRIYFDQTKGKFQVSENGNPYVDMIGGAGASPWMQGAGMVYLNNLGDKVGIGTNTPAYSLDVLGDAQVTNGISSGGQIAIGNSGNYQTFKAAEFAGLGAGINLQATGAGGRGYTIYSANGSGLLNFDDESAGATRMVIGGSGNIGIGTTSPSQRLDVVGNLKFSGALMPNNNAGVAGQVLTSAGAGLPPTWQAAALPGWALGGNSLTGTEFLGSSNAQDVVFKAGGTELMRLLSNNSITFTAGQYSMTASTAVNPALTITGANFRSTQLNMKNTAAVTGIGNLGSISFSDGTNSTTQAYIQGMRDAASSGAGDLPTALVFYTTPDASGTEAERMRIANNGRMGIGTAAPSAMLHAVNAATTGASGRFENNSSTNTADAVFVINSGTGAAVHAISAATSTVGLWLENGHLKSTQASVPVTSTVSVSGGGISAVSVSIPAGGTDVKGVLNAVLTTTTIINSGNNAVIRVTFSKAYTTAPVVVLTSLVDPGALNFFISSVTPTSFNVTIKNSTPGNMSSPASMPINLNYMVIE